MGRMARTGALRRAVSALASLLLAVSVALACDTGTRAEEEAAADATDPTRPGVVPGRPSTDGAGADARDGGAPPAADGGPTNAPDEPLDPGGPAVQLIGRFDRRDARGPQCGFPGCRILARFDGTAVSVKLEGEYWSWMEGAPSEWDVSIDGVVTQKLVLTLGEHSFDLATGLAPGPHLVELYKRTESQTGLGRFLGFDFKGGRLLAPPARKTRHLEIIGDSQPAAFGVEHGGLGPNCPGVNWAGTYQNFRKSFSARLGDIFGAEVFGTVYSGKGIAQNIWSTDDETMPLIYGRANPIDPASRWDWSWTPDAVLVMMGGNDFAVGQPFDRGPTTVGAFTDAFRGFAGDLRGRYPNAWLVLLLSPSVSDAVPEGRQSRTNVATGIHTVVTERVAAGDARILELAPPVATPDELVGCNGHGTAAYHERVAQQIRPVLAQKLGW